MNTWELLWVGKKTGNTRRLDISCCTYGSNTHCAILLVVGCCTIVAIMSCVDECTVMTPGIFHSDDEGHEVPPKKATST